MKVERGPTVVLMQDPEIGKWVNYHRYIRMDGSLCSRVRK